METTELRSTMGSMRNELDKNVALLKREMEQSVVESKLADETEFMSIRESIAAMERKVNDSFTDGLGAMQVR